MREDYMDDLCEECETDPCLCGDTLSRCPCPYCYCMDEAYLYGPCDSCLVHGHQG